MKTVAERDSDIVSEAAGVGMGLVDLRLGSNRIREEKISVATETEH